MEGRRRCDLGLKLSALSLNWLTPDWSPSQLEKHHREIQAQLGNYFLRVTSPRLAERVAPALQSGKVTMENCFSETMKLLLRGSDQHPEWIFDEDVDVDRDGRLVDPNLDLLSSVLALPEKLHEHMENFEVGLTIEEIMTVLKLVSYYFIRYFQMRFAD